MLLDISIACLFVDAIILNGNYNTDDTAVICWLFVYVVRILFFMFFMESLILAQDERWRRA